MAPALFDLEGLLSSLHGLRSTQTPQSGSSEEDIDAIHELEKDLLKISEIPDVKIKTTGVPPQGDPHVECLFPGLPMPTYSAGQSWAADTCCDEEAELMSIVLRRTTCFLNYLWGLNPKMNNSELHDILETVPEDLREPVRTLLPAMYKMIKLWYVQMTNRLYASALFEDRTYSVTQTGLVGVGGLGCPSVEMGDRVIMLGAAPFPMVIRSSADGPGSRNRHELVRYVQIRGLDPQEILNLPQEWWPELHPYKII